MLRTHFSEKKFFLTVEFFFFFGFFFIFRFFKAENDHASNWFPDSITTAPSAPSSTKFCHGCGAKFHCKVSVTNLLIFVFCSFFRFKVSLISLPNCFIQIFPNI